MLLQVQSDVITRASEHDSSCFGMIASLLSEPPRQLVCGAVTSESP